MALPAHPGESLDLDEVFERVLIDIGSEKVLFTIGKAGILWKLDRADRQVPRAQGNGLSERLREHRSEDRCADLPRRHPEAEDRRVVAGVSEHGRRTQLAGDGVSPRARACSSFRSASRAWRLRRARWSSVAGSGGTAAGRRFFEMPGSDGNRRQARRLRRDDDEGSVEHAAARGVSHRGADDWRRTWSSSAISIATSAPSTCAPAKCCGRRVSARRCRAFPVSFTANGKQYVAVTTGLGGGSPAATRPAHNLSGDQTPEQRARHLCLRAPEVTLLRGPGAGGRGPGAGGPGTGGRQIRSFSAGCSDLPLSNAAKTDGFDCRTWRNVGKQQCRRPAPARPAVPGPQHPPGPRSPVPGPRISGIRRSDRDSRVVFHRATLVRTACGLSRRLPWSGA